MELIVMLVSYKIYIKALLFVNIYYIYYSILVRSLQVVATNIINKLCLVSSYI
jgi:hypothetical protein